MYSFTVMLAGGTNFGKGISMQRRHGIDRASLLPPLSSSASRATDAVNGMEIFVVKWSRRADKASLLPPLSPKVCHRRHELDMDLCGEVEVQLQ